MKTHTQGLPRVPGARLAVLSSLLATLLASATRAEDIGPIHLRPSLFLGSQPRGPSSEGGAVPASAAEVAPASRTLAEARRAGGEGTRAPTAASLSVAAPFPVSPGAVRPPTPRLIDPLDALLGDAGFVDPRFDPARLPVGPNATAWPPVGYRAASVQAPGVDDQSDIRRLDLRDLAHLLDIPAELPVNLDADGRMVAGEEPLDLSEGTGRGLANSLDVAAAAARSDSFRYGVDAARGAFLPHLDVTASRGKGELESVAQPMRTKRGAAVGTFRQAIIDEAAREDWDRQKWLAVSAEHQLTAARFNAMLETGGAWLATLQGAINLRLSLDYEDLLQELSRYIGERAAAGGTSPAERDRVDSRVANIRAALADARATLESSLRTLESLTGQPVTAVTLDLPADAFAVPADRRDARELALRQNADLLAARAELRAAELERDTAKAKFLPKLALEVSQNRGLNALGSISYTRDNTAMLVLNVPLLAGGADLAAFRAAQARTMQLDATARGVERKLLQQLDTAYAGLDASTKRYASAVQEVEANARVVAAFRAQLVGTNRSLLDVLDAYQHLYQSRVDLAQTFINQAQNHLRIAQLAALQGLPQY